MKPYLVALWHSLTNDPTPSLKALEAFAQEIEKRARQGLIEETALNAPGISSRSLSTTPDTHIA